MSNFKLDIYYPVEFEHEDKMATPPEKIEYSKQSVPVQHYGKLLFAMFDKLKEMPEGPMRDALAQETAEQMYRSLASWGFGSVNKERVVDDLARFTNGKIQMMPDEVRISSAVSMNQRATTKKKKK